MEQKKIDRISELTRISRERELTEEEQKERAQLRREYIDSYKASLTGILDNTYIQNPDGILSPRNGEKATGCDEKIQIVGKKVVSDKNRKNVRNSP